MTEMTQHGASWGGATQACGQSPETLKRGAVESCMASDLLERELHEKR